MRVAATIELNADEEKALKRLARSNTTSVRLARRACICCWLRRAWRIRPLQRS